MKNFHPWLRFLVWKDGLAVRRSLFLRRRPHRSFRRTRRRDYVRTFKMPGYWAFTAEVWAVLWRNKRLFCTLILLYAFITILLGGITNQQVYQEVSDLLSQSAGEVANGAFDSIGQAAVLLATAFFGSNETTSEQQIYLTITAVMSWMVIVWLLRELMAGRRPKLRDGLYNAGSPIIATVLVALIAAIQLIPAGVVALIFSGLNAVGVLQEGVGMMLFGVFAMLILTLILYWMTSTFLALVIVTLPGMYPMEAMRAAGDLVTGRRLRVLYRVLWMFFVTILAWAAVMIPVVLLDTALKNIWPAISNVPVVPIMAAIMTAATLVWTSSYIYMLYRRLVNDSATPA